MCRGGRSTYIHNIKCTAIKTTIKHQHTSHTPIQTFAPSMYVHWQGNRSRTTHPPTHSPPTAPADHHPVQHSYIHARATLTVPKTNARNHPCTPVISRKSTKDSRDRRPSPSHTQPLEAKCFVIVDDIISALIYL